MNAVSDLNTNLREVRTKKGLSQNDVAERLGITRQAVSRWETGHTTPDPDNLALLSQLYDMPIAELLECVPHNKKDVEEAENTVEETVKSPDNKKATPLRQFHFKYIPSFNPEYIFLIFLLILSSTIYIVGLIMPIFIFVWTWRNKRQYKLVLVLSVIFILIGLYQTLFVIYLHLPIFDTIEVEMVSRLSKTRFYRLISNI